MDNLKEISEVIRKASLASISKPVDFDSKITKEHKPKDNFYVVHILCLLFGLLNLLPLTFFVTANGYWMYKFRDTSKETVDLNNKTTLQTYFVSGSMVVQTVPSVAFMLLSTIVGHRFSIHSRVVVTLSAIIAVFVVFTSFIKVNTDTWQVVFFVTTLLALSLITGVLNLFQVSSMGIIPKLPPVYMKTFLFGQGMSGIFSGTLQIISLALGTSTETSALFYFVSGTVVVAISFVLYLFCQKTSFYQYYTNINMEDKKKTHSRAEIKYAFIQIWPCLAMLFLIFFTMTLTHPSITALVVSEHYGNGNKWNDDYFVPAVTFLFGELCSQVGRLLSRPLLTKSNGPWMVGLCFIRMLVLVPLVMLSNAQPRNNIPVLLKHDWEYICLCVVYFMSQGFLLNVAILSIPKLTQGNQEIVYLVLMSFLGIVGGISSPFSLLAVRILSM